MGVLIIAVVVGIGLFIKYERASNNFNFLKIIIKVQLSSLLHLVRITVFL